MYMHLLKSKLFEASDVILSSYEISESEQNKIRPENCSNNWILW
jgi:hypothetical protein